MCLCAMLLNDFDFCLPEGRIAYYPCEQRDQSKLLVVSPTKISHARFDELKSILVPGDVLVLNTSKVISARLIGQLSNGKEVECFLLEPNEDDPTRWNCLLKPARVFRNGSTFLFFGQTQATVLPVTSGFQIQFDMPSENLFPWVQTHGKTPLPPYIRRSPSDLDKERYQTVYAESPGSVAAPTAGLHFTPSLLDELEELGVHIVRLTLHVGYGTFAPIREEDLDLHNLHPERYSIPKETVTKVEHAKQQGRRVIAVGTTSLRALESMAQSGQSIGKTSLFIRPGFRFSVANGLITNFHLPKSSLFVLVSAILGPRLTKDVYQEAIRTGYQFYSYGDSMIILRGMASL